MRLSHNERHWKHWEKLARCPHNQWHRYMAIWQRFFKVRPVGFIVEFKPGTMEYIGLEFQPTLEPGNASRYQKERRVHRPIPKL